MKTKIFITLVLTGFIVGAQAQQGKPGVLQKSIEGEGGTGACDCNKGCMDRTPVPVVRCAVEDGGWINCWYKDGAYTRLPCN